MFRSLRISDKPQGPVFSVTIGPPSKQTLAGYCLPEPADVIDTIETINTSRPGHLGFPPGGGPGAVATSI